MVIFVSNGIAGCGDCLDTYGIIDDLYHILVQWRKSLNLLTTLKFQIFGIFKWSSNWPRYSTASVYSDQSIDRLAMIARFDPRAGCCRYTYTCWCVCTHPPTHIHTHTHTRDEHRPGGWVRAVSSYRSGWGFHRKRLLQSYWMCRVLIDCRKRPFSRCVHLSQNRTTPHPSPEGSARARLREAHTRTHTHTHTRTGVYRM